MAERRKKEERGRRSAKKWRRPGAFEESPQRAEFGPCDGG